MYFRNRDIFEKYFKLELQLMQNTKKLAQEDFKEW